MRASRVLALSGVAIICCMFLAACGGGGTKPAPVGPPSITSTVLSQATINVPYSFYLTATGGEGNYTWAITAGALPPGLTFSDMTAQISGTPTTVGSYSFTAQVTDSDLKTGTANLTLVVGGVVIINCTSCSTNYPTTLPSGTPDVPYNPSGSPTFSASGGQPPYTWCVVETGGNGTTCDNGSGGALPAGLTMSTAGAISGTPTTAAAPVQFTVQATDSETIAAHGTAMLTLTIMGITTNNLPSGEIYIPYSQQMTIAGGTEPYSWCVMESNGTCDNGSGGALPAGLTLAATCANTRTTSCTISGTPTQVGSPSFTLKVTDGETPPSVTTQQLSISIAGISNALLAGNYALVLNGYTTSSCTGNLSPFVMAAAFYANGSGGFAVPPSGSSYGYLDLNDGCGETISHSQVQAQNILSTSTYSLNPDGTGTITIMTDKPATYQFNIAVTSNACKPLENKSTCGSVIVSGTSPQIYGSGSLLIQNSAYFAVDSIFPGNFALQAVGTDKNTNRYAAAGAMGMDTFTLVDINCGTTAHHGNGWNLNHCPLDEDAFGTTAFAQIGGAFGGTLDSGTGRGNDLNLSFPSDPNGTCNGTVVCTFAYYIINHQELVLISADNVNNPAYLTLWFVSRQTSSAGGWTLSALTGSSAMELSGVDSGNADVTVGLLNSQGNGNASFNSDENDGGTLNLQQSSQGTYTLDPNIGQTAGKITLSGFSQFGSNQPVLYMIGSNYAFVVGTDAKVTSGIVEGQTGSPFTDLSIINAYAGGSIWPTVSAVTDSATFLFADGAGNFTGTQYTSGSGGAGGPNPLSLNYSVDSTGRAVIANGNNAYGIGYVVSPTKFVLLPTGDGQGNPQPDPVMNVFVAGPNF